MLYSLCFVTSKLRLYMRDFVLLQYLCYITKKYVQRAHPNLRLPDLTVTASVMVPMPGVTALIATQARPLRRHGGRRRLLQACQWHASAWSHLLADCGRACGGGF